MIPGRQGSLFPPHRWASLQQAAQVVREAMATGSGTVIWGHDDVDGITATAILLRTLRLLTPKVSYYVPPRTGTKYGLDQLVLGGLAARGVGLLITVDCGITSGAETAKAKEAGLAVVITDHHEPPADLPPADAIVNPKLSERGRPNPQLAGCGVALYLAAALGGEGARQNLVSDPQQLAWAALGTVSDKVPLVEENREIVRLGLPWLASDTVVRELADLLGIDFSEGLSPQVLQQTLVGFLSSGVSRGDRHEMLELLMGEYRRDRAQAIWRQRLQWQARADLEYRKALDSLSSDKRGALGLVVDPSLPADMAGTIAGKLRDALGVPAVVIASKNGLLVGECRGFEPFDFPSFLSPLSDLLLQYGGHKQAAGFTIRPGCEGLVAGRLESAAEGCADLIQRSKPAPAVPIEVGHLADLEPMLGSFITGGPYGPGNPGPTIHFRRLALPDGTEVPVSIGYRQLQELQDREDPKATPVLAGIDVTHTGAVRLNIQRRG